MRFFAMTVLPWAFSERRFSISRAKAATVSAAVEDRGFPLTWVVTFANPRRGARPSAFADPRAWTSAGPLEAEDDLHRSREGAGEERAAQDADSEPRPRIGISRVPIADG